MRRMRMSRPSLGGVPSVRRQADARYRVALRHSRSPLQRLRSSPTLWASRVPSGDLLSADLMGSDAAGVGVSDAPLGFSFPTEGGTFAILSSGLASSASLPNNEGDLSFVLGRIDNSQGNDLVRLHLELSVWATLSSTRPCSWTGSSGVSTLMRRRGRSRH